MNGLPNHGRDCPCHLARSPRRLDGYVEKRGREYLRGLIELLRRLHATKEEILDAMRRLAHRVRTALPLSPLVLYPKSRFPGHPPSGYYWGRLYSPRSDVTAVLAAPRRRPRWIAHIGLRLPPATIDAAGEHRNRAFLMAVDNRLAFLREAATRLADALRVTKCAILRYDGRHPDDRPHVPYPKDVVSPLGLEEAPDSLLSRAWRMALRAARAEARLTAIAECHDRHPSDPRYTLELDRENPRRYPRLYWHDRRLDRRLERLTDRELRALGVASSARRRIARYEERCREETRRLRPLTLALTRLRNETARALLFARARLRDATRPTSPPLSTEKAS